MDRCGHSQGSPGGSHQAPSVLQGTGGMSRSKGVQSQVRGQWWVPCLPWWEFVKGFLREDISEVMVLGQCRQDNGSVCDPPIYAGFGPQNITVITSQESHYWNAFLIRIHFPHPPKYGRYGSYYTSLERSG